MKQENRGGARQGAGRKKNEAVAFSNSFKRKAMKALKDVAAALEMTDPFQALATLALSDKIQDTVRLGAWKIYSEMNVVKESKQEVNVNKLVKPQIYLPEPMDMPEEARLKLEEAAARMH